jgi:MFS family permease
MKKGPPVSQITVENSLLKNRNFMLLWSGQLVSWVGTEITNIVLPLLVLALTGSTVQAGGIAAMRGAVYVLWAIPAGALVDRWNRKTVMVIANLGSGLAMGSIYGALLLKHLTIPQLYLAGAIEGSCFVFANLARFAAFPRVVSREQFPAAAAQSSIADNLALLVGPPLGGFLYQTVGAAMAFFADSISYFVNAVSIFFINAPLQLERTTLKKALHKEVLEGLLFLWRQPTIRFLNLLSAGRTMLESGLYLLVIVLAKEHHATSFIIGSIFAFGALGGLIGASFASRIHQRLSFSTLLIATTTLNFLVFTLYAFATTDLALAIITAALFAINPVYEVTTASYTVSIVPDAIRGRILSLTRLVVLGAYSLGFFVTGIFLQFVGSTRTIVIFSCLLLALALMVIFNKALRQI